MPQKKYYKDDERQIRPKVSVLPEIYKELKRIADEEEVSISVVLNQILRKRFPKNSSEVKTNVTI